MAQGLRGRGAAPIAANMLPVLARTRAPPPLPQLPPLHSGLWRESDGESSPQEGSLARPGPSPSWQLIQLPASLVPRHGQHFTPRLSAQEAGTERHPAQHSRESPAHPATNRSHAGSAPLQ